MFWTVLSLEGYQQIHIPWQKLLNFFSRNENNSYYKIITPSVDFFRSLLFMRHVILAFCTTKCLYSYNDSLNKYHKNVNSVFPLTQATQERVEGKRSPFSPKS